MSTAAHTDLDQVVAGASDYARSFYEGSVGEDRRPVEGRERL
jgi:hypothetical protein